MRDHHVAKRPGLLVEAGAALDVQRLGHVDLHVGDVVAVPHRLEHAIGKAQCQDVLRRLLAQEVVDAVDRVLVQDLVQRSVELPGAGLVMAEGLLDHERAVVSDAAAPQHAHHLAHRARRHAQVHEPLTVGADLRLGVGDRLRQRGPVLGGRGHEAQPAGEVVPVLVELTATVMLQRVVDAPAEVVVGARRVTARADDPELLRHQPLPVEVEEPREQLATGKIAGGAEDDEHPVGRALKPAHALILAGMVNEATRR